MSSKLSIKSWYNTWLAYKVPAYINAILIVIAFLAVWYLKPADTIYIEKRVRVEVPIYIIKTESSPAIEEASKSIMGNSLSDQQGLQDLLVSGE